MAPATRTEMQVAPAMSLAEWLAMPEDEPGELVGGRLVEEEVPDYIHEVVVAFLVRILGQWVSRRGGVAAGSEAKLTLGPGHGRKPDVTVYLPGRKLPPRRGPVREAPDVAVEVLSPEPRDGRRDRIEKVAEYAVFGIRYYWIVDPELRTLEILELGADRRYARALVASSGVVDPVPGCEGLGIDLDPLWSECDRLSPEEPALPPPGE